MIATYRFLGTMFASAALSACATTQQINEGKVVMNPSNAEIHVRFQTTPSIKEGELLRVSRRVCQVSNSGGSRGNQRVEKCQRREIGEGSVVRTYNEQDFVMKVSEGVQVQEGDFVRRESISDQKKEAR